MIGLCAVMEFFVNKVSKSTTSTFIKYIICVFKGNHIETESPSSSIIIISTLAFSVVCFNAYEAILTSDLLYERDEIKSIDDLGNADMFLGVVLNSSDYRYLKSSTNPQIINFFDKISRSENLLSNNDTEMLMRATTSKLVLFSEQASMRNSLKKLPIEDQCLISEVPVKIAVNKYGFPTPLKSPYRKLVLTW